MATKSIVNRINAAYTTTQIGIDGRETSSTFRFDWNCDRTQSGTPVPRYRELIANLQNASSSYSASGKDVVWSDVSFSSVQKHPTNGKTILNYHTGFGLRTKPVHAALPVGTAVKGGAVAAFYSKLADTLSQFKGLVALGEMKETLSTIGGLLRDLLGLIRLLWVSLRNIRKGLRLLRKRKVTRKKRRSIIAEAEKAAASRYLEFTFGVQPILQDIEDLYGVLCEERSEVQHIRATRRSSGSSTTDSTTSYCGACILSDTHWITETSVKSTAIGAVKLVIPERPNGLKGTAEDLGFTMKQVLPSLWELTPFSFLLDYVVNVGDLINTAVYGSTDLVYGVVSTTLRSEVKVHVTNPRQAVDTHWTYPIESISGGFCVVSLPHWSFTREPLAPSLAAVNFTLPVNARQWANMIALFIQWAHKFRESSE